MAHEVVADGHGFLMVLGNGACVVEEPGGIVVLGVFQGGRWGCSDVSADEDGVVGGVDDCFEEEGGGDGGDVCGVEGGERGMVCVGEEDRGGGGDGAEGEGDEEADAAV